METRVWVGALCSKWWGASQQGLLSPGWDQTQALSWGVRFYSRGCWVPCGPCKPLPWRRGSVRAGSERGGPGVGWWSGAVLRSGMETPGRQGALRPGREVPAGSGSAGGAASSAARSPATGWSRARGRARTKRSPGPACSASRTRTKVNRRPSGRPPDPGISTLARPPLRVPAFPRRAQPQHSRPPPREPSRFFPPRPAARFPPPPAFCAGRVEGDLFPRRRRPFLNYRLLLLAGLPSISCSEGLGISDQSFWVFFTWKFSVSCPASYLAAVF